MKVFYQDCDIIVCEKEYGVSSQKSNGANMIDLISEITHTEVFPVHRLDTTTVGLMVYALNQKSASELCAQVASGKLEKEYLAVAHGNTPDACEMVDMLFHDRLSNKSFVVTTSRKGAKQARLELVTLKRGALEGKELSLVKIRLLTGRTHQIRVQLSSRAFPLYGDGKYGAKDNAKIALYSHSIAFSHPKTHKKMKFEAFPKGEIWDTLPGE